MIRRATSILSAAGWAITLSAQEVQPKPAVLPEAPVLRPETERLLRQYLKKRSQPKPAVCSIPLVEVPIQKNVARMPNVLPPAPPEEIDRMQVEVPAPPCEEEKR